MSGPGADEFFHRKGGFMVKTMFSANPSKRPPAAYQADGLSGKILFKEIHGLIFIVFVH